MYRKAFIRFALVAMLLGLSSAVFGATPRSGGTLKIAASSLQSLQLYKTAANDITDAQSVIFDSLFILSKDDFKPIPSLAESWKNPDPLTWVFSIRKGVLFHDPCTLR